MVTWVRLGTFTQFFGYILWKVWAPWIGHMSFIWESYGDLSKVRYFHPIFCLHSVEGEKHHELDWRVSSEKAIVTWLRLGTFTQSFGYILLKVCSTMNWTGEFFWESNGDLSKVRYFHPIFWLHSVEGEKPDELDWWVSSEKVMVPD